MNQSLWVEMTETQVKSARAKSKIYWCRNGNVQQIPSDTGE